MDCLAPKENLVPAKQTRLDLAPKPNTSCQDNTKLKKLGKSRLPISKRTIASKIPEEVNLPADKNHPSVSKNIPPKRSNQTGTSKEQSSARKPEPKSLEVKTEIRESKREILESKKEVIEIKKEILDTKTEILVCKKECQIPNLPAPVALDKVNTIKGPTSCQRVQIVNVSPGNQDFPSNIDTHIKSIVTARPIPNLGQIYRRLDNSSLNVSDWFIDSVESYLNQLSSEFLESSLESTDTIYTGEDSKASPSKEDPLTESHISEEHLLVCNLEKNHSSESNLTDTNLPEPGSTEGPLDNYLPNNLITETEVTENSLTEYPPLQTRFNENYQSENILTETQVIENSLTKYRPLETHLTKSYLPNSILTGLKVRENSLREFHPLVSHLTETHLTANQKAERNLSENHSVKRFLTQSHPTKSTLIDHHFLDNCITIIHLPDILPTDSQLTSSFTPEFENSQTTLQQDYLTEDCLLAESQRSRLIENYQIENHPNNFGSEVPRSQSEKVRGNKMYNAAFDSNGTWIRPMELDNNSPSTEETSIRNIIFSENNSTSTYVQEKKTSSSIPKISSMNAKTRTPKSQFGISFGSIQNNRTLEKVAEINNIFTKPVLIPQSLATAHSKPSEKQKNTADGRCHLTSGVKVDVQTTTGAGYHKELSKMYQYPAPSFQKNNIPGTAPIPSYIDCVSEILEKTTNLEVPASSQSEFITTFHFDIKDNLSQENLEEITYIENQSDFQKTTPSECLSRVNIDLNTSDVNVCADTWSLGCYQYGNKKDMKSKLLTSITSKIKKIFRKNSKRNTPTRARLRYRNPRSYCPVNVRNRTKTLFKTTTFHENKSKFSSSIEPRNSKIYGTCHKLFKAGQRWRMWHNKTLSGGRQRLMFSIFRTMLCENVDMQTRILLFTEIGNIPQLKDQESMAVATSLRIHSLLVAYNKWHPELSKRKLHQMTDIYGSRSMFPLFVNKLNLKTSSTLNWNESIGLRPFHSTPGRLVPSFQSCANKTEEIQSKDAFTSIEFFCPLCDEKLKSKSSAKTSPISVCSGNQTIRNDCSTGTEDLSYNLPETGVQVDPRTTGGWGTIQRGTSYQRKTTPKPRFTFDTKTRYPTTSAYYSGIETRTICNTFNGEQPGPVNKGKQTENHEYLNFKPVSFQTFIKSVKPKMPGSYSHKPAQLKSMKTETQKFESTETQTILTKPSYCVASTTTSKPNLFQKDCSIITDRKALDLEFGEINFLSISSNVITPKKEMGTSTRMEVSEFGNISMPMIVTEFQPKKLYVCTNTQDLITSTSVGLAPVSLLRLQGVNTTSYKLKNAMQDSIVQCTESDISQMNSTELQYNSANTNTSTLSTSEKSNQMLSEVRVLVLPTIKKSGTQDTLVDVADFDTQSSVGTGVKCFVHTDTSLSGLNTEILKSAITSTSTNTNLIKYSSFASSESEPIQVKSTYSKATQDTRIIQMSVSQDTSMTAVNDSNIQVPSNNLITKAKMSQSTSDTKIPTVTQNVQHLIKTKSQHVQPDDKKEIYSQIVQCTQNDFPHFPMSTMTVNYVTDASTSKTVAQTTQALSTIIITDKLANEKSIQVQFCEPEPQIIYESVSVATDKNATSAFMGMTSEIDMRKTVDTSSQYSDAFINGDVIKKPIEEVRAQCQMITEFTTCKPNNNNMSTQYSMCIDHSTQSATVRDLISKMGMLTKSTQSMVPGKDSLHVPPTNDINHPADQYKNVAQSKPVPKTLSSRSYSQKQLACQAPLGLNSKLENNFLCLSRLLHSYDERSRWSNCEDTASSSLDASKWIRRCGLPIEGGKPSDDQFQRIMDFEQNMEISEYLRLSSVFSKPSEIVDSKVMTATTSTQKNDRYTCTAAGPASSYEEMLDNFYPSIQRPTIYPSMPKYQERNINPRKPTNREPTNQEATICPWKPTSQEPKNQEPTICPWKPTYQESNIYPWTNKEPNICQSKPRNQESSTFPWKPTHQETNICPSKLSNQEPNICPSKPSNQEPNICPSKPSNQEPNIYPSKPRNQEPNIYPSKPRNKEPNICPSKASKQEPTLSPWKLIDQETTSRPSKQAKQNNQEPTICAWKPTNQEPTICQWQPINQEPTILPSQPNYHEPFIYPKVSMRTISLSNHSLGGKEVRSASMITSRIVLPRGICRGQLWTMCPDCVFVYEPPKCLVHYKSMINVAVQQNPSLRDVELEMKREHAIDDIVIGYNASSVASSNFTGIRSQVSDPRPVIHMDSNKQLHQESSNLTHIIQNKPVLDAQSLNGKDFLTLFATTKMMPKLKKPISVTNPSITKLSPVTRCCHSDFSNPRPTPLKLVRTKTSFAVPSPLDNNLNISNVFNQEYKADPILEKLERRLVSSANSPFLFENTLVPEVREEKEVPCSSCKVKEEIFKEINMTDTELKCGGSKTNVQRGPVNPISSPCCYYHLLTKRIGHLKDSIKKHLKSDLCHRDKLILFKMESPEKLDFDIKLKENETNEEQEISNNIFTDTNSLNVISNTISKLDICGSEKNTLNVVYHTLTAIEGRIRRLRRNMPE